MNQLYYFKKIADWLLPNTCLLCRSAADTSKDLCSDCLDLFPVLLNACTQCALPLPQTQLCARCLKNPPFFTVTHSLYHYQPPITYLLLDLKFKHALKNARLLGEMMAEHIQHIWYQSKPLPDMILPVPLHSQRLRERGFNQALELARPIAKRIQRPLPYFALERTKLTTPQTTLSADARQKNLQNAFAIHHSVANCHIAVIDDVITTGATINELCRTLKKAGAKQIDVWCCARAFYGS